MADSDNGTRALFFSPEAARHYGSLTADTPSGKVEYTANYPSRQEAEETYGWRDKVLVWEGPEAEMTNIRSSLRMDGPERPQKIVYTENFDADARGKFMAKLKEIFGMKKRAPRKAAETWDLPPPTPWMEPEPAPKKKPPQDILREAGENSRPLNMVFCQDAMDVHADARGVVAAVNARGYKVSLKSVNSQKELLSYFDELKKSGAPGPDAVFMDVGGVGLQAAVKVVSWFDENRPTQPLPAFNFLSLSTEMAVTEAGRLRDYDARLQPHYVDPREMSWTRSRLEGAEYGGYYAPETATFRNLLNGWLGTDIATDHKANTEYESLMKKLKGVANDGVLDAWINGKLTPAETIERMRGYAAGVTDALREGLYARKGGAEGIPSDARFYAGAGFPLRGKAVFTPGAVELAAEKGGQKPVLFMQSYDPAVVPLLASGKLGGLVVTSPYMASHLKLLCETHMVSGLFGLIPPGKSLSSEFNEEARPDLPPYFDGGKAVIAGKTVRQGEEVVVGLGQNGLAISPPPAKAEVNEKPAADGGNEKLAADLRNLRLIEQCFTAWFKSQGLPAHSVKANIDSTDEKVLGSARGIGLVRTEQMVATNAKQVGLLKKYLLQDDDNAKRSLCYELQENYQAILQSGKPVKIRMFDFVHREILNKDEQKKFEARYGRLDIHGGEALETWPGLYRDQLRAVFQSYRYANYGGQPQYPLEIMMPAVRTEADVVKVKALAEEMAAQENIKPEQYSFGVMAETLEACGNIGAIAKHVDFISFGTNDLTSEFFNMSRSDLKAHDNFARRHGFDPFRKMAPDILELMQKTTEEGRAVNPKLRVDVCGAQAADPDTALKLFDAGIDNVSVAPTLANIYALPVTLAYRLYDALQALKPQPAPQAAPMAGMAAK